MTRQESYQGYQERYEYHGNTAVEITRNRAGVTVKRDWVLFDSVEEAQEFFNNHDNGGSDEGHYVQ